MEQLLRLYVTDKKLLSPRAPEGEVFHDDAPSMLALCCLGASQPGVGEILFI